LESIPSATNFVTIDCGKDTEFAQSVLAKMLEQGMFIRMPGVAPQSRCIRVSVGHDWELDMVDEVLGQVLEELK
ncbi:MAG: pyridoxal phosphate-dependent aminotransferase, partial [Pseudomonadota bacterium]